MSPLRKIINFLSLVLVLLSQGSIASPSFSPYQGCENIFLNNTILASKLDASTSQISAKQISDFISNQIHLVPEFEVIRDIGKNLGLRVWLFGGTASSFLHYVKWDLISREGIADLHRERFDYDFTNIFRSTQDIDIVVDGSPEAAIQFQTILEQKFPHFLGDKANQWEVRTLRHRIGNPGEDSYKEALLEDSDFQGQNTDSHSIGMIEITPHGEDPIIRDLKNWNQQNSSLFLEDALKNQITFLRSKDHFKTSRAIAQENPEILSVLRILVKSFQYELSFTQKDWESIQSISEQFNPQQITHPKALRRIKSIAKKLITQAADLEQAVNQLDALGLRKKLITFGDVNNPANFAWLLNREPLRSFPIGQGKGRTAQELKIDTVAHETKDFLAYESITRAPSGKPNVFISRKGIQNEIALLGDGFYTSHGQRGGRGTGITIRFKVDPRAREGTDFVAFENPTHENAYLLFKNKAALRIIPESMDMSPLEYFNYLAGGYKLPINDQALVWKLKRRLQNRISSRLIDPQELKEVENLVLNQMQSKAHHHQKLFYEWLFFEGPKLGTQLNKDGNGFSDLITGAYRANPEPTLRKLHAIAQGTQLESWIQTQLIPDLLSPLKKDLGARAIQNCLFSEIKTIQKFGNEALTEALQKKTDPYFRALGKIFSEKKEQEAEFSEVIRDWLSQPAIHLEPNLIEEKAEFISKQSHYQDWLKWIPGTELELLEKTLAQKTTIPLFRHLAKKQGEYAEKHFLEKAKTESFQFIHFEIPKEEISFRMGSPTSEEGRWDNEHIRNATLTESFEFQATPLTLLQKALLLGEDITLLNDQDNYPATLISWFDAKKLIEKLNQLDPEYLYRLPFETEWEYAARAGTTTAFSFGESSRDISDYAIHIGNSNSKTYEVASRKPNPAGLYDIHGNVWEWCEDLLDHYHLRITRGGSWGHVARALRSARITFSDPALRAPGSGMRLVRTRRKNS